MYRFEIAELAGHHLGEAGGGDGAVFGVAVDEDFDITSHEGAFGNLQLGKKDVAKVTTRVEEDSHGGVPHYGEFYLVADFCHEGAIVRPKIFR